ncbi:MAG: hypothetical protein P8Y06_00880 [Patescibacteria group bacterium]|jgi:hypothetical protein
MTEAGEQYAPFSEMRHGEERRILYKNDESPSRVVIGRDPLTKSASPAEKQMDDFRIKLSDADRTISRRAVILDVFTKAIDITNTGQLEILYRTEPEQVWRGIPPNEKVKLKNTVNEMRNFELKIGKLTLRSGLVGGEEKALQSLILI